jgi:hypothetical protein
MIFDFFNLFSRTLESPTTNGMSITPSDSVDLTTLPRCVTVAAGTTIRGTLVDMPDGQYLNFPVSPGVQQSRRFKRIWSTGTDCTGIVAEW